MYPVAIKQQKVPLSEEEGKGPYHPTLGLNLRFWRKQRGLTGPKLAKLAGISKGFLSEVENGKTHLGYPNACKIAALLGVHVSFIWDHRDPPSAEFDRPPGRLS